MAESVMRSARVALVADIHQSVSDDGWCCDFIEHEA